MCDPKLYISIRLVGHLFAKTLGKKVYMDKKQNYMIMRVDSTCELKIQYKYGYAEILWFFIQANTFLYVFRMSMSMCPLNRIKLNIYTFLSFQNKTHQLDSSLFSLTVQLAFLKLARYFKRECVGSMCMCKNVTQNLRLHFGMNSKRFQDEI